jgi:hypothetical protein
VSQQKSFYGINPNRSVGEGFFEVGEGMGVRAGFMLLITGFTMTCGIAVPAVPRQARSLPHKNISSIDLFRTQRQTPMPT